MVGTMEKILWLSNKACNSCDLNHIELKKFLYEYDISGSIEEKHTQLINIFNQIQQDGFYIKFETENDFYCIASPLLNSKSIAIGAISIVIPKYRYNEKISIEVSQKLK